jgi:hypothetical protein
MVKGNREVECPEGDKAELIIVARNPQPKRGPHCPSTWFLQTQHGSAFTLAVIRVGSHLQVEKNRPRKNECVVHTVCAMNYDTSFSRKRGIVLFRFAVGWYSIRLRPIFLDASESERNYPYAAASPRRKPGGPFATGTSALR